MPAPYQIAGQLPFAGGGVNQFMGLGGSAQQSMANLGTGYANAYSSALANNQTNYNNILSGYQQTLGHNVAARDAIGSGYTDLTNSVLGGIADIGQSRQNDINAQYAQQSGQQAQQLINRGLGNSTVQQSVQRGLQYDQARSSTDLANQIAQTTAGYRSQLGQATLGFSERAVNANSGDAQNQIGWMNSVNAPYPDAGQYANLASQFGAANQQEKDRALAMGRGLSNGPPSSAGGYIPSGGGFGPNQNFGQSAGFSVPQGGAPMGSAYNLTGFAPASAGLGIGAGAYNSPDKGGTGGDSSMVGPGGAAGDGQTYLPGWDTGNLYQGAAGAAGDGGAGKGYSASYPYQDVGAGALGGMAGAGGWGGYSWLG